MTTTTIIDQETVEKINQLSRDANSYAHRAVKCAKQLGALLIEVKAKLGHGEFTPWIEQNLEVTPRQARRYINAALGRPGQLRLETKTDIVSVFKELPIFLPMPGFSYFLMGKDSTDMLALVECSRSFPAFFFVTIFDWTEKSEPAFTYSPRPIEGIDVHDYLQFYGVTDTKAGNWRSKQSEGVLYAGESIHQLAYLEIDRIVPQLSPRKLIGQLIPIKSEDKKRLNPDMEIDLEAPYIEANVPEQVRAIYVDALLVSLTDPQPPDCSFGE
jgi:hypothetical protein